jgi:hypothetical protein
MERRKEVIKEGIVMNGREWGPEGRRKLSRGGPDKSKRKVYLLLYKYGGTQVGGRQDTADKKMRKGGREGKRKGCDAVTNS